MNLTISNLMP